MKTTTIVGFLSSAVALTACGTSQKDACVQYAQAFCDQIQSCFPDSFVRTFNDISLCDTRVEAFCAAQFPTDTALKPSDLVACAQAMSTATCGQVTLNDKFTLGNLPECNAPAGKRDDGTVCATDSQCASASCNHGAVLGFCGTCGELALQGGDCSAATCAPGLLCQPMPPGRPTCVTPYTVGAGGQCLQSGQCVQGSRCVQGQCMAVLNANDTCDPARDACDPRKNLQCDNNTMRCTGPTYVSLGAACNGARTLCTGSTACVNDVCVGPAGDGQRSNYNCLFPAGDFGGVCVLPDPEICNPKAP
jgi:hypothetical protein